MTKSSYFKCALLIIDACSGVVSAAMIGVRSEVLFNKSHSQVFTSGKVLQLEFPPVFRLSSLIHSVSRSGMMRRSADTVLRGTCTWEGLAWFSVGDAGAVGGPTWASTGQAGKGFCETPLFGGVAS